MGDYKAGALSTWMQNASPSAVKLPKVKAKKKTMKNKEKVSQKSDQNQVKNESTVTLTGKKIKTKKVLSETNVTQKTDENIIKNELKVKLQGKKTKAKKVASETNVNQNKVKSPAGKKSKKKKALFGAALRQAKKEEPQDENLKIAKAAAKRKAEEFAEVLVKKKKAKVENSEDAKQNGASNKSKKKKKTKPKQSETSVREREEESDEEMEDLEGIESRDGFNPPKGIVHESLLKKGKKRKSNDTVEEDDGESDMEDDDDEDSDDDVGDGPEKTGKQKTRLRKDRVAKLTDSRTIFIGNLSLKVTKKALKKLFTVFGKIETLRFRGVPIKKPYIPKKVAAIKKDFHPDRNTCTAYVKFAEEESAVKACVYNGKEVEGIHIRVDMAARPKVKDHKISVFIGNLAFDVEEETIRKHFQDCGEIDNVRLIRDKKAGLGKGFGYIAFQDTDAVSFALKLNDSKMKGRPVRVESSDPKASKKQKKLGSKKKHTPNFKPSNKQKGQFQGEKAKEKVKKLKTNKKKPSHNPFMVGDKSDNSSSKKVMATPSTEKTSQKKQTFVSKSKSPSNKSFNSVKPSTVEKTPGVAKGKTSFAKDKTSFAKDKPSFAKKTFTDKPAFVNKSFNNKPNNDKGSSFGNKSFGGKPSYMGEKSAHKRFDDK